MNDIVDAGDYPRPFSLPRECRGFGGSGLVRPATYRAISGLSLQTPSLQIVKSAGSKTVPLTNSSIIRSTFSRSGSIISNTKAAAPSRSVVHDAKHRIIEIDHSTYLLGSLSDPSVGDDLQPQLGRSISLLHPLTTPVACSLCFL